MDHIYGTLNLLILRILGESPAHGLRIKHAIEEASGGALTVEPGALYPALHRLHRDRLLTARWGVSEKGRRAKIYDLTKRGRARLDAELESWRRHTDGVAAVIERRGESS